MRGRSGAAVDAAVQRAAEYFEEVVRSGYQAGEPVFLYGHPTGRLGRHPQVVQRVFDTASQPECPLEDELHRAGRLVAGP